MPEKDQERAREAARRLTEAMEQSRINTQFRAMTRTQELKDLWAAAHELTLKLAPYAPRTVVEELFKGVIDPLFQMLDVDAQTIASMQMRTQLVEAKYLKALAETTEALLETQKVLGRLDQVELRLTGLEATP